MRKARRLLLGVGRALLACAALTTPPAAAASQEPETAAPTPGIPPLEVLHGFTLIDGLGGPPVPDGALAVRADRIVSAGPRARVLEELAGAEDPILVDLGGGWVVPGLIDAHVHLATAPDRAAAEAELLRLLRAGITTVRDMAGDARSLASLARDARTGVIQGPDVHFSALVAGPTFFSDPRAKSATAGAVAGAVPWMQALTPESDPVLVVALARGSSASGLKIYADLDADQVRRITDEAHRQGMPVWAHAMVHPARPLEVVRSGVDVVSHACALAWEAMADAPDRYHQDAVPDYPLFTPDAPVFDELFREMAGRGTILDATLAMHLRGAAAQARPDDPSGARHDARGGRPAIPPMTSCAEFAPALVRRAHAAGVRIAAGTDFSTPPGEPPALLSELEALVQAGGLSPMEAIGAATRVAAAAAGLEDVVGTLQAGMRLDFVVLDEDPSRDVRNLRSVREVWKGAARYPVGSPR